MPANQDPALETDDLARNAARTLLHGARFAAIGFNDPVNGAPAISRLGFGLTAEGTAYSLVSEIALHCRALRRDPRASLLISEAANRGDPLNSPRLSLQVTAHFLDHDDENHATLRSNWLAQHPKSKLYIDFSDFHFVRFAINSAAFYGGFGRAYLLAPADLS